MKQNLTFVLAIAILLSACSTENGLEVNGIWMRPTAQGDNGAVYFVLHNHSPEADEMTSASSDIAEAVEMHETTFQAEMNGDIMEMNQVQTIPMGPYAEIDFAPGKYHIMLVNVQKNLNMGDEIEITLHFKNFEDINRNVPVQESPAPEDHSASNH